MDIGIESDSSNSSASSSISNSSSQREDLSDSSSSDADKVNGKLLSSPKRETLKRRTLVSGSGLEDTVVVRPETARENGTSKADAPKKGVHVYVRLRPDNDREMELQKGRAINFEGNKIILKRDSQEYQFRFDSIIDEMATQEDVYELCARPMVKNFYNGYNAAMLVYGQSGSGKTHTILGCGYDNIHHIHKADPKLRGIVPRFLTELFAYIYNTASTKDEIAVQASYLEIYNEKVRDLLVPSKHKHITLLQESKTGLLVHSASQVPVTNAEEVLSLIEQGGKVRAMAKTDLNEHSSRSHAIFVATLWAKDGVKGTKRASQLYMVDLAGSESVAKSNAQGVTMAEAGTINRSLLSLGNVIDALVTKRKHVPYRDSKLTRLLQNSLGGNSLTSIILCCSQNKYNAFETLSTLRFGDRANRVQNTPKVNQHISAEELKRLLDIANQKVIYQAQILREKEKKLTFYEDLVFQMLGQLPVKSRYAMMKRYGLSSELTDEKTSFLSLGANAFAYIFTFLEPKEFIHYVTVCKFFEKRLQSEFLWGFHVRRMLLAKGTKGLEIERQITSFYHYYVATHKAEYKKKIEAKFKKFRDQLHLFPSNPDGKEMIPFERSEE